MKGMNLNMKKQDKKKIATRIMAAILAGAMVFGTVATVIAFMFSK